MISGGRSDPVLRLIDDELERQLPHGRRVAVPDGTHKLCNEQSSRCADEIRTFLQSQGGTR